MTAPLLDERLPFLLLTDPSRHDLDGSRAVPCTAQFRGGIKKTGGYSKVRLQVTSDPGCGKGGGPSRQGQVRDELVRQMGVNGHAGFMMAEEFVGCLPAHNLGRFSTTAEGGETGNSMLVLTLEEEESSLSDCGDFPDFYLQWHSVFPKSIKVLHRCPALAFGN